VGQRENREGSMKEEKEKSRVSIVEPRAGFEPATCRFPADYKAAAFQCLRSGICQAEPPRRPGWILRMMLKILP